MATAALIPVSEYLSTIYEPDCDYVDGELQERNMGELAHGVLQGLLVTVFNVNMRAWDVTPGTEVRVRVNERRVRIPDVCVLRGSDPFVRVVERAPLICIEIFSPEDREQRTQEKIDDHLRLGVDNIWLIDPITRHAWVATSDGSRKHVTEFAVAGTPIRVVLADVFADLDYMQKRGQ